ncbi:MAG: ATP-binding protein [Erysipelotrichaceae bacterium]|nr:ATP-binding protein [Erysipelotrichaceae bacterium]
MLTPEGYKPRLKEKKLDEYQKVFGAVCIEGPKFCGKTWMAMTRSESAVYLGNPKNNFQMRTMAEISPESVLQGPYPKLLDEWQEVPPLWDAVRFSVDQGTQKGMYLLTGSATPNHKGILHSGTGRIGKLKMNTMSLYETGDSSGQVSLKSLFDGSFQPVVTDEVTVSQLIHYVVRGGWPGNLQTPAQLSGVVATEYLKTVVDDDMYKTDGIRRDAGRIWALLHSLGRNECTLAGNTTIQRDINAADGMELDTKTIAQYLDIFTRLFLLDNQPAYNPNLRSSRRVLKQEKRHFTDPSLAVAALGATEDMLYNDLQTFGFLFESLCTHDLKIYAEYHDASLFHFRDEKGNEADAIVEFPDGTWGAFEVKLGANKIEEAAASLLKLKAIMEKESDKAPSVLCVLCGMTNMAYKRPDGVYVVPITALKP